MAYLKDYNVDWDPLTEDYNDPNFNSYDSGAGANIPNSMQPANYRRHQSNGVRLWVSPISHQYNKDSLRNIFSNYGEVTDVYIFTPKNDSNRSPWAYVTLKTMSSANDAIRAINDQDTFGFKVKFAKDDGNRRDQPNNNNNNNRQRSNQGQQNRQRKPRDREEHDSNVADQSFSSASSNPSAATENKNISFAFSQDIFPVRKPKLSVANFVVQSDMENNVEGYITPPNCGACKKKTFMVCSSCQVSFCDMECSLNGWKLHVGDACVKVSPVVRESSQERRPVPNADYVPKNSKAIFNKEFAGACKDYVDTMYGPGKAKEDEDDDYLSCSNGYSKPVEPSFKKPDNRPRRGRDDVDASSRWSNQDQNEYGNDGDGVERNTRRSYQDTNGYQSDRHSVSVNSRRSDQDFNDYEDKKDSHIGFERRNNDGDRSNRTSNERKPQKFSTDSNYGSIKAQSRIDKSRRGNEEEEEDGSRRYNGNRENSSPQVNQKSNDSVDERPFVEGRLRIEQDKNIFVFITAVSSSMCSVRIVEEEEKFREMMVLLNERTSFAPTRIENKGRCVVKVKDGWHRGLIVSNSKQPRVKFIDYGACNTCQSSDIREIPPAFAKIPPFAHTVKFTNVSDEELAQWKTKKESVEISPTKFDGKMWMVEHVVQKPMKEQLQKAREERDRRNHVPVMSEQVAVEPVLPKLSTVDQTWDSKFETGVPIEVYVAFTKGDVICVSEADKIQNLIAKIAGIDSTTMTDVTSPRIGSLYLHYFAECWCRGKVVSTDPFKIYYIDYGNEEVVTNVDELKVLPTELAKIPPLVVEIVLAEGTIADLNILLDSIIFVTPSERISVNPVRWKVYHGKKSLLSTNSITSPPRPVSTSSPNPAPSTLQESPVSIEYPKTEKEKTPVGVEPKLKKLRVYITFTVSKSEYYGFDKKNYTEFTQLASLSPGKPVAEPSLGLICACDFEGIWCRAKIIELSPLTIHFLDFGNDQVVQANDLREISEHYQKLNPMAFKMTFPVETKTLLEYSDEVDVLWDPVNDSYQLDVPDSSTNAVKGVTENSVVNIVSKLGGSRYGVMLEERRDDFKYIMQLIDESVHLLERPDKIRIRGKYLANFDGIWHRSIVIKLKPLTVYFLDFAQEKECNPDDILSISTDIMEIAPLAFQIETEDYVFLNENDLVSISQLKQIDSNTWKVVANHLTNNSSSKRVQAVADPSHVEKVTRKLKKLPATSPVEYEHCSTLKKVCSSSNVSSRKLTARKLVERSPQIRSNVVDLYSDDRDVEFNVGLESLRNDTMDGESHLKPKNPALVRPKSSKIVENGVASTSSALSRPEMNSRANVENRMALNSVAVSRPEVDSRACVENKATRNKDSGDKVKQMMLKIGRNRNKKNSTSFMDFFPVPVRKHINQLLEEGDTCVFIPHHKFSTEEYSGMLLCNRLKDMLGILDTIEQSCLGVPLKAKKNDLVVTFLEPISSWCRGLVLREPCKVDPVYLVILLDVGIIHRTDAVYPLPECFYYVHLLCVRCTIKSFPKIDNEPVTLEVISMQNTSDKGLDFRHNYCIYNSELVSQSDLKFTAKLWSQRNGLLPDQSFKVEFTPWRPTKEEIGVNVVELNDGEVVKMSAFAHTNECYVIPVNDDINDQRNQLQDSVVLHCQKTVMIDHEPKIGEIVGVPCMNSFWRARILEHRKHCYIVQLLDMGQKIKVFKKDLKELPDDLKFADAQAVGVTLKNVPRTDFTKDAEELVKYVAMEDIKFTLHFDPESHLVELKFGEEIDHKKKRVEARKGSSFNGLLDEKLVPVWLLLRDRDLDFESPLYYLKDLRYEEWEIGSELSLFFVEHLAEQFCIMINRNGETYSKLIDVNLVQRMTEYAAAIKIPHVPVVDELCIAEHDGEWYRAVCHTAKPGELIGIQFIDIGFRKVKSHLDIRRMHVDFLKHPAAALICEVENYEECSDIAGLEGRILCKCKITKKTEDGGYSINVRNLGLYEVK